MLKVFITISRFFFNAFSLNLLSVNRFFLANLVFQVVHEREKMLHRSVKERQFRTQHSRTPLHSLSFLPPPTPSSSPCPCQSLSPYPSLKPSPSPFPLLSAYCNIYLFGRFEIGMKKQCANSNILTQADTQTRSRAFL